MENSKIILDQNAESVQYLCQRDKRLAKVIQMIGPITYQPHKDGYSFLVHEIIEQMLSTKVSNKLFDRLLTLCNGNITPVTISALSLEQIRSIGTSTNKVSYIQNITNDCLSGKLCFDDFIYMPDTEVISSLCSIKGIGPWTAKMYLIFVLDRQDILPFEDYAFLTSYKWLYNTTDVARISVEKKCKKWKPYSSIGARYMYKALDLGFTKQKFHLYKD